MAARAILTTMAAATAALALAAPAQADPIDDAFLAALNNAGVGYSNPGAAVDLGKRVCPALVQPGKDFASVASQLPGNNSGLSPQMASFFAGIAVSMYCPQMITSISDGTILSKLGTMNMLPGIGRFPW